MSTQVTTTDSKTGIPPNTGMVKTVLQFSSSASALEKLSVLLPPFLSGRLPLSKWIWRPPLIYIILLWKPRMSMCVLTILYKKRQCFLCNMRMYA